MNARRRIAFGRDRNDRTAPTAHAALHHPYRCLLRKLDVVTDRRIDPAQKMPDWIEVREYHPNVEKSYWDAHLTPIWVKTKKINFIEFVGYIKPPKSEGFKP